MTTKTKIIIVITIGILIFYKKIEIPYNIQEIFMLESKLSSREVINILVENISHHDIDSSSNKEDVENLIKHFVLLIHLMIKENYTYHIDFMKLSLLENMKLLDNLNKNNSFIGKEYPYLVTNEDIEKMYHELKKP